MDTGLDAINTASKKVAQRAGKFLGNKITDAVTMIKLRNMNVLKK